MITPDLILIIFGVFKFSELFNHAQCSLISYTTIRAKKKSILQFWKGKNTLLFKMLISELTHTLHIEKI